MREGLRFTLAVNRISCVQGHSGTDVEGLLSLSLNGGRSVSRQAERGLIWFGQYVYVYIVSERVRTWLSQTLRKNLSEPSFRGFRRKTVLIALKRP